MKYPTDVWDNKSLNNVEHYVSFKYRYLYLQPNSSDIFIIPIGKKNYEIKHFRVVVGCENFDFYLNNRKVSGLCNATLLNSKNEFFKYTFDEQVYNVDDKKYNDPELDCLYLTIVNNCNYVTYPIEVELLIIYV